MGRNLSNLYISQSFQYLVQTSGSEFQNGLGTKLTGSYDITVANAGTATSALVAVTSVSSSYAAFATTASYALNVLPPINTGSFVVTASVTNATTTFTKADNSTFNTTINNVVNASSASVAISSSYALQATSASYSNNSTSASYSLSSTTSSYSINGLSASYSDLSTSASYALNSTTATTASYATNFTASNILITGLATVASASITYLTTIYETASVIYSSGSNIFGDASNDVQTLYGTVDIKTGPLLVTGSVNVTGSIIMVNGADIVTHHVKAPATNGVEIQNNTGGVVGLFGAGGSTGTTFYGQVNGTTFSGSLQGTASYATNALSASYSNNSTSASYAINATSASYLNPLNQQLIITGSVRGNVTALSIASQTASLDFSLNNFYTLQLVSGSNTYINVSNIFPGQTINLLVSTTGSGTVSFSTNVKQVTGASYIPTTTTSNDILSFVSFDSSAIYLNNIKNFS